MYFFVITDGTGWLNRVSDLVKIIEFHHRRMIDMVYTRSTIGELGEAIRRIVAQELD